jgi:hypothetical protein
MTDPGPPAAPADQSAPTAIHLPRPTVWPAALAAGIALLLSGWVFGLAFSVAGLAVVAISLVGWIRELLRE